MDANPHCTRDARLESKPASVGAAFDFAIPMELVVEVVN